ncbi:MAG TPA: 3-dehydroquinate synthase family protein, partial [Gemmatimonadales bacterium]|nr:3-dehydroquinate synthase family protein [Gemmatimonadales bacterium]
AFPPPRFVLADVDLLATLPRPHLLAGMAEAIKHGAIADEAYFTALCDPGPVKARDCEALLAVVRRSVEIKAAVVREDPRESGRRAMLNFGHTVAHALEAVAGYSLLHGEALAIGMCVEAEVGEALGATESGTAARLKQALKQYDLPVTPPDELRAELLLEAMRRDKKNRAARIRLALPQAIGAFAQRVDGAWTVEVDETRLQSTLH